MISASQVGLPAIIRPSFTLGGTGGGIAYNKSEFFEIVEGGAYASGGGAAVAGRLHGAEIAAGSGHGHGDDEGEAEADLTKQSKGRDVHGESPVRSLAQRSGAGVHATRESHLGTGG